MASPIYDAMGDKTQNNPTGGFPAFMQQMRGQDPNAIINQMIKSGRISQQQLNFVQGKAQQMQGMFDGFRRIFGF